MNTDLPASWWVGVASISSLVKVSVTWKPNMVARIGRLLSAASNADRFWAWLRKYWRWWRSGRSKEDDNSYDASGLRCAKIVILTICETLVAAKSTVPASFDDAEPFVLDARRCVGLIKTWGGGWWAGGGTDHEGHIRSAAWSSSGRYASGWCELCGKCLRLNGKCWKWE